MKWYWVRFNDFERHHVIGHTIPENLMDYVLQDLAVRQHVPEHITEVIETFLDMPGYYIIGTPEEAFRIDDLKVNIPTCYVGLLKESVLQAGLRDEVWHKVHTWRNCLCLNSLQRTELYEAMADRAETANKKYDRFMAAWEKKHKGVAYV